MVQAGVLNAAQTNDDSSLMRSPRNSNNGAAFESDESATRWLPVEVFPILADSPK